MAQGPLPVVVNRSGGTAASLGDRLEREVHEAFAGAGLSAEVQLVEGPDIERALKAVAGAPVVAVGGGDGTLGQAAGILAEAGTALGILPLGTRNHLARQLGLPAELAEAVKVIARGRRTRIDLARAGSRVFVNNASIGLYSRLVLARDAMPGPKWLGTVPAAVHVLRHPHSHMVELTIDGTANALDTPLLFIGNNRYVLEQGALGTRESLADGRLSFYAVAARTPLELIGMALRVLAGRADPQRDLGALQEGTQARIAGHGSLDVAVDGEVQRMTLPLDFSILPGALEVLVP
jgi:diacylglycerol kinase family enzyme